MSTTYHTKYRPSEFDLVLGQDSIVASLKRVLKEGTCRAFIFHGPSGTGKTTLSRIVAAEVGCKQADLVEVDAATNTGIDAMRSVTENMAFATLNRSKARVYIIDEVHSLSKQAWQSLLKPIEEPPSNVYWCLCTTEAAKIPPTIKTRCTVYELKPVSTELLYELVSAVVEEEKLEVNEKVIQLVAEKSQGSPRRALTMLSQVAAVGTDIRAAAALVKEAAEDGDAVTLCKALMKGELKWEKAMKLLQPIKDQNAESVRLTIVGYMTAVLLSTKSADAARMGCAILDAFGEPYPGSGGIYPVILSLGQLILE